MKKDLSKWWMKRNDLYSMLCDDEFTNFDVVAMHVTGICLIMIATLANAIGG